MTKVEFLIYQKLTGNLGATYYCQTSGDLSGEYVPLAEYEALNEKRLELGQQLSNKFEEWEAMVHKAVELKQANTELKDIIKSLLFIFDRDLPPNSIGRLRCDEASALLVK